MFSASISATLALPSADPGACHQRAFQRSAPYFAKFFAVVKPVGNISGIEDNRGCHDGSCQRNRDRLRQCRRCGGIPRP